MEDVPLNFVATFLLVPPINLLLLAIAGFILVLRQHRAGRWILGASLFGLLVFALPITADSLLIMLEEAPARPVSRLPPAAIVILGGDIHQMGGADPRTGIGSLSLERLLTGAELYRTTHLPVLTTGGILGRKGPSIADLMAQTLQQDFAVPTRWIEASSRDTWENAELSSAILKSEGIDSVFLVTHAWHMRRARIAFARFGIAVTPVPTSPDKAPGIRTAFLLPSASAWLISYYALHEWIGCAWYALRAHWQ
jgi:uncharacterized SAM-binding protein YcdF (DUF218 family)